jgi:hypothetical protein
MNMIIRTGLLCVTMSLAACSSQLKGPVTGTRYKVDVGCTEDMQRYKQEREEVTGKQPDKVKAEDIKLDCPGNEPPAEDSAP